MEVELFVDRTIHRLTPLSVQTVRFRRSRLGYNMRDVDRYLDEIAAEMTRLHQRLQHRADDLPVEPTPTADPAETPTIAKVRVLAIHCASQIISEALIHAARIYERAHQQADELLADALRDAQQPPSQPNSPPPTGHERRAPSQPVSDRAAGLVLPGPWPSSGRKT